MDLLMCGFVNSWIYVFMCGCICVFVIIHKHTNMVLWFCCFVEKHKSIMLIISPIRRLP